MVARIALSTVRPCRAAREIQQPHGEYVGRAATVLARYEPPGSSRAEHGVTEMLLFLVGLIVLIMLFGAAAIRSAIAMLLCFGTTVLLGSVLWGYASEMSASDWAILGGVGLISVAATFLILMLPARQATNENVELVWKHYQSTIEERFDEARRKRAEELRKAGDAWALDEFCATEERKIMA